MAEVAAVVGMVLAPPPNHKTFKELYPKVENWGNHFIYADEHGKPLEGGRLGTCKYCEHAPFIVNAHRAVAHLPGSRSGFDDGP